jgi:hypothetical protein
MQAIQSILASWDGLIWLLVLLAPLLLIQRGMHFELQAIFLLITRSTKAAIGIFSLLFLPGVLLHEVSHFLMAKLLRVRTARFSLLPTVLPDGKLQMGFVETEQTDFIRDALIGIAPLISGGVLVAYLGLIQLALAPLGDAFAKSNWGGIWDVLRQVPNQPDFWIWFYLTFTFSTTMLPSESDRRAWLPLALGVVLLVGAAALAGGGPWLLENLAPLLNNALRGIALVFGISLGIHVLLWIPLRLLRELLARLTHTSLRTAK